MMHYNELMCYPFWRAQLDVVLQPSCLLTPYNDVCWEIQYPNVEWKEDTVVIMHCQDFVTITDNQCPELKAIESHFGKYANRVVVIHWEIDLQKYYTGPLTLLYLPTHSYELMNSLASTQEIWKPKLNKEAAKHWQCLNGTPRSHRELVVPYMRDNFSNGILSLAMEIPLADYGYDQYQNCNNVSNWEQLLPVYADCPVNIVTETLYYRPGILTEKTLMAFLAMQLPIVIGHKGIVDQWESLGFDMFRDIVDTSYDYFDDDIRWKKAIDLNNNLLWGFNRTDILERLERNREYALNVWPEHIAEQFNNNARGILGNLHPSS